MMSTFNTPIKIITKKNKNTPINVLLANRFLKEINFVDWINERVTWDSKQCKVSPGQLAKSIVLSTFTQIRQPLSRIGTHFETMDTELLFEKGVTPSDLNDDALARTLDRMQEAGCSSIFSSLALHAYTTFQIQFKTLHSDTSSRTLYGEYSACDDPNYKGLLINHGHSKDHRPDLKQVMVGHVVNEYGMPISCHVLNGNTSDCQWNQDIVKELRDIWNNGLSPAIYVADSKLVTEPNLSLLVDPVKKTPFISRCPDNFSKKMAVEVRQEAYDNNQFISIGTIGKGKRAACYEVSEHERIWKEANLRLIVCRSSAGKKKLENHLEQDKKELERGIAELRKRKFVCEPDAQYAAESLLHTYRKNLWDIRFEINSTVVEKRRPGRPSKQPVEVAKTTTWTVVANVGNQNVERVYKEKQKTESFVLITNVRKETMDAREILACYKEQRVVEIQFHLLKQPALAAQIFIKTPGRIEALITLLQVSLLIRSFLQYRARKNLENRKTLPKIDFERKKLDKPTSEKILLLLSRIDVETELNGDHILRLRNTFEEEKLNTLMELLEIKIEQLIT